MGKTQRREKDISIRREEILDAAERVYDRQSFDTATMDMIASEAEFTKQTLYAYFKGKEEIFTAVYVRSSKIVTKAFLDKLEGLGDASGFERLDALREEFIKIAVSRPLYIRMMTAVETKDLKEIEEMGIHSGTSEAETILGDIFADCIIRGISDGSMKQGIDPIDASLFLKACISGTLKMMEYNKQYLKQKLDLEPYDIMERMFSLMMLFFRNDR